MLTLSENDKQFLERKALAARKNVLRMIKAGKAGHVGGALSIIDAVTALYFKIMNIDPQNPQDPDRDRFILSAGHKCLALYSVLAEAGFFNKDILDTYGSINSKLPGHPDMHKIPGVESNTGALGHGLSISVGIRSSLSGTRVRVSSSVDQMTCSTPALRAASAMFRACANSFSGDMCSQKLVTQ